MDIDAEREKITKEIKELERILDPRSSSINLEVSESSLESDSDADSPPDEDSDGAAAPISEEERWGEASNDEDDARDKALPEDPETCLQLNMVYQEVIQEKLAEIGLLLAQNREQQEEVMWDLAGSKGPRVKDGKSLSPKLYIGHFMKPYFKDKVTGVGPPANDDTREKAAQGIKAFEDLLVTKWKGWEKALLRKSVVSDRLQRLLQPKLLKLEYLEQKRSRGPSDMESAILEKQSREAEREIQEINQLSEEALLGDRLDSHDWEKISNVNFEGGRSAQEIQKFWQNWEHPSINKQEWSEQEVGQLKAIAATHGHLEWQRVAEELGTGRSAFQCLQEYQRHNTALKRREWTQEEDRMLTQLVQEMRVGSHIPYRRIVYYMEGRDSVQLIYRWTKSLDPSLKRGSWAPEEDAKLLRAVAKYGEQDWFKIRAEVPGRSDAQCRDRYVRRLHSSLKKGRWNSKEEEKLIELIEKHGIGRWAKIASELPHRTGSQCLSKWKFMVQKQQRQGRRRRPAPSHPRWSSSSGDSSSSSGDGSSSSGDGSSSSEDSESENPEAQKGARALSSVEHAVPDVDLWVPARQSTDQLSEGAASPSAPKGSKTAQDGSRDPSGTRGAGLGGTGYPRPVDAKPPSTEGPADESGRRLLKVPLETVLRVLRANTAAGYRTLKEKLKLPGRAGSRPWPSPSGSASARPRERRLHWGHALQRRLLDRRLLMAVSPWVGDVVLPCSPQRPVVLTRADSIRMQLQDACLSSTPVFTLFIQLFQIDTAGCMEVVRERKARLPALPQADAQAPSSAPDSSERRPQSVPEAAEGTSRRRSGALQARRAEPTPQAPCAPRPKPKTVSELLREKRLREARARRAAQGPVVLRPHLLVTSPVILQPPLLPACPGGLAAGLAGSSPALPGVGAPAAASTSAPGSWASASKGPPVLQALAIAPAPTLGPGQVPGSCHPRSLGHSQAPATCRKQGLPEAPHFLPAAPSPTPLPVPALGPTLAPATPSSGLHTASSTPLPVTWLLTAQGGLLVTVSPSLTETQTGQGLVNVDVEPGPPCRTDLMTLSTPPPAHTPAEADSDVAQAPGGPSSPGEARVARETAPPADHPEAEPSQQPLHNGAGPGGTPASLSEPRGPRGPLDVERQPPPQLGPEKGALDLGLLSQESETAVRAWLQGQRGVCVPSLRSPLPYQPPSLGSLRVLSGLLLRKQALERRAAALEPLPGQLQRSPAYLLLKARFMAAFTLPALLATLPPPGVLTTLSAAARASPESEDSDLGEQELPDGHRQPVEGAPDPDQGPVPSCLEDPDDLDVLRTRRTRHVRKRRRLL